MLTKRLSFVFVGLWNLFREVLFLCAEQSSNSFNSHTWRILIGLNLLCPMALLYVADSNAYQFHEWDASGDVSSESVYYSGTEESGLNRTGNFQSRSLICTDVDRLEGTNISPVQLLTPLIRGGQNEGWTPRYSGTSFEEGETKTHSFRLSSAPTGEVTVTFTDGSDPPAELEFGGSSLSSSNTLTFSTSDWCQMQSVSFTFVDNSTVDDYLFYERARANISLSGGGAFQYQYYIRWSGLKDNDQDKAGLEVTPNPLLLKNVTESKFSVRLKAPPSKTVTVETSKDIVVDIFNFIFDHKQLLFTKGNWDEFQSVNVTVGKKDDRPQRGGFTVSATGSGYDKSVQVEYSILDADTTPPTLKITGLPSKIKTTNQLTATFTFSEVVTGFEKSDITVNGGTKGNFSGSGSSYKISITPAGARDVSVIVPVDVATDSGNNTGPKSIEEEVVKWDNTPPDVTIDGPESINTTDPFDVTFTFTEHVTDFVQADDIFVWGGDTGDLSGEGGTYISYTLPITPLGTGNVIVTVFSNVVTDGLNIGPPVTRVKTVKWKLGLPPTVEIDMPKKINTKDPFTASFTFSEPVTDFINTDVMVSGATKGNFSESGQSYTLEVTPLGDQDVVVTVPANAAMGSSHQGPIADKSATAEWDSSSPSLEISGLPPKINSTNPLTATFTFSEDVTEFEVSDISISGGTKGMLSGSGNEYILEMTPSGDADVVLTVSSDAATDGINRGPENSVSQTVVWDSGVPTLSVSGLPSKINTTDQLNATFAFSEDVTEFQVSDISISGATKGTLSGSGSDYMLEITPSGDADVVVTVSANAVTDGINRGPEDSVSETVVWDSGAPTLSVSGLPSKINTTDQLNATFAFSEDVTEFQVSDISISGATKGTLSGSGSDYMLEITPSGDADVVVTVSANAATDGINRGPPSEVSQTVSWDSNPPGVKITGLPSKISSTTPLTATFTFTEDIIGFTTEDVKVTVATKGIFTAKSTTEYTLQVIPSGSGNVVVTVVANAASDGINTGPAEPVSVTSVWDGANPGVTISGVPEKINSRTPFTTTFTFSENVTEFIADDVVITGAAKGTWSVNSATTYTLVITPSGAQDVVVTIPANVATDGTNQGPSKAVTKTAIWDADPPTVTISGLPENISTTDPLTATFTFSENVTEFFKADVTVTGATKGTFTAKSSSSYTLAITPTGQQNVVVQVPVNVASDGINTGPPRPVTATSTWNSERVAIPLVTTLHVDQNIVGEGGQVKVTARITGALNYPVDIPLVYRAGNPEPALPSDYSPVNTLTIEAGKKTAEGIITIEEDDLVEKDEVFIVSLGTLDSSNLRSGNPSFQPITIQDRTILPTVILSPTTVSVNEGETITVTVSLSRILPNTVTIPLTLHDGTAIASEDYTIPQRPEVTISAGYRESTLDIFTKEDDLLEEDETFTVSFGELPPVVEGSSQIEVTIVDDDAAEIIVSPDPVTVVEEGRAIVQVSLSSEPSASVILTINGYREPQLTLAPARLIFTQQNWNQSEHVTLTAGADNNSANETVTLTLTANGGGYVAVTEELQVTIRDNDTPQLVVQSSLMVDEGGSAPLNISLTSAPLSTTTVTLSASENPDLSYDQKPLTFSTNDWEEPKTVMFSAESDDDFQDDGPHEFILTAVGYTDGVVTGRVLVTIDDKDEPELMVNPPSLTIEEDGPSGSFQVALNGRASSTVNISFSGYAGMPISPPQPLRFTPTGWNQPKTVTLTALQDDEDFDSETFDLRVTANGGDYVNVTETVSITIQDNDKPLEPLTVSINDKSVYEDEELIQLEVELSRATDQVVLVQYRSLDGTAEAGEDYTASRGIVIFDPNATQGLIDFEIENDGLAEQDGQETFEVILSNPVNAGLGRAQATATILDPLPVTTLRIEDVLVSEDAHSAKFQVDLHPPSSESVVVRYQTEDGSATAGEDYQPSSGTLEFTAGVETMTIEVPLLDDETQWQAKTFTIRLETSEPIQIEKAVATATITDDGPPLDTPENALIAYTIRFMRTSASEIIEGLGYRLRNQPSACSVASRRETAQLWHSASSWNPSLAELLGGCHITSSHGAMQVWGRGGYRRFQGFQREEDQLRVEADVSTAMAGVDYRWDSGWLTGVLVAHSRGEGSSQPYNQKVGTNASVTGVYPYLAYQTETWGIWGTAGLGNGQTENDVGFKPTWRSGFGALGVQGRMAYVHTFNLRYYGDVLMTSTELYDRKIGVTRIRAGMEASAQLTVGLQPYMDAGVRQDAGSAENGVGLELGGGMRVMIPALRLKGDVRMQRLVMHTADGFTEWGVSGSLEFGSRDKGVGLRVTPSWGPSQRRGITTQQTILDVVPSHDGIYRTEMELGYGIPLDETIVRSIVGITTFDQGTMYRFGGEVRSFGQLSVSAYGIVHSHDTIPRNIGMNLQGVLQY
ncbi:MAG: Ig-like domain-containing protein [Bacteroidetes bacterium]|nr:Ig-like domain-containing protein [Bacteroidota bacterium]